MTTILDSLARFTARVMNVIRALIGVLLVCSVLLNFANVCGRKFLSRPIIGAEEVMNFLMVSVVFLGAGCVAFDGTHINMEILVDRLPARWRTLFLVAAQIAAIVVAVILIYLGIPIIQHLQAFDERSQAANVPLWIPQVAVPIGLALLAIGSVARIAVLVRPQALAASDDVIA